MWKPKREKKKKNSYYEQCAFNAPVIFIGRGARGKEGAVNKEVQGEG